MNPALISGLDFPRDIAISGSNLFIVKADLLPGFGTIGQYTTSGDTVNPDLISGLSFPSGIAVVPTVPEPGILSLTLFGVVLAGLGFGGWRKTGQKTTRLRRRDAAKARRPLNIPEVLLGDWEAAAPNS